MSGGRKEFLVMKNSTYWREELDLFTKTCRTRLIYKTRRTRLIGVKNCEELDLLA